MDQAVFTPTAVYVTQLPARAKLYQESGGAPGVEITSGDLPATVSNSARKVCILPNRPAPGYTCAGVVMVD